MSNDFETKLRSALEKGKPLIEAVIADLEREATLIKERDLDPRKLAEEPRVQEARSGAVDALEQLTGFAKSLDSLVKSYAEDLDKRVDVDKIKEQLCRGAGRWTFDNRRSQRARRNRPYQGSGRRREVQGRLRSRQGQGEGRICRP